MKQLTDSQLINLLSVGLGITFALSGVMIYYFRNEVQHLIECLNQSFKREQETLNEWYEKCKESNDDNLRLIKQKQNLIDCNKLLNEDIIFWKEHLNSANQFGIIRSKHNKKYSTICRKLYNQNQDLKLENQGLIEKITELESKKLKERRKK